MDYVFVFCTYLNNYRVRIENHNNYYYSCAYSLCQLKTMATRFRENGAENWTATLPTIMLLV